MGNTNYLANDTQKASLSNSPLVLFKLLRANLVREEKLRRKKLHWPKKKQSNSYHQIKCFLGKKVDASGSEKRYKSGNWWKWWARKTNGAFIVSVCCVRTYQSDGAVASLFQMNWHTYPQTQSLTNRRRGLFFIAIFFTLCRHSSFVFPAYMTYFGRMCTFIGAYSYWSLAFLLAIVSSLCLKCIMMYIWPLVSLLEIFDEIT